MMLQIANWPWGPSICKKQYMISQKYVGYSIHRTVRAGLSQISVSSEMTFTSLHKLSSHSKILSKQSNVHSTLLYICETWCTNCKWWADCRTVGWQHLAPCWICNLIALPFHSIIPTLHCELCQNEARAYVRAEFIYILSAVYLMTLDATVLVNLCRQYFSFFWNVLLQICDRPWVDISILYTCRHSLIHGSTLQVNGHQLLISL